VYASFSHHLPLFAVTNGWIAGPKPSCTAHHIRKTYFLTGASELERESSEIGYSPKRADPQCYSKFQSLANQLVCSTASSC
jgi:hypothetical protein